MSSNETAAQVSINGVVIASVDQATDQAGLRQRACSELLRQAAIAAGDLVADDPPPTDGVITEAASIAIERHLETVLDDEPPAEQDCRRYFDHNVGQFGSGERLLARHVLFAVTPGVDVAALRQRAEACLIDLRAQRRDGPDRFAEAAAKYSNCPSAENGGELGWLCVNDCAPEFAKEIFGKQEQGVLQQLVHSRFGLHIVEVLDRQAPTAPTFEQVQSAVENRLRAQRYATALRHYLQTLESRALVEGIDLAASEAA